MIVENISSQQLLVQAEKESEDKLPISRLPSRSVSDPEPGRQRKRGKLKKKKEKVT